jgi:phenylacetate-CoA ligase
MLSDTTCREYIDRIRRSAVRGIHGYANAVYRLATYCMDHDIDDIRLDFVLTTAETLFDPWRPVIEQAFHCRVFDHYGSRETSLVSHECPRHDGYHVSIDTGIIELVRNGNPVGPGEAGDVLVTEFHNHAMPLIRYEIGDVAVASPAPFSCCSLPFPTIHAIEGRTNDMITLRDGRVVNPILLVTLLSPNAKKNFGRPCPELRHVDEYQIVQESFDDLTVNLVLKPGMAIARYDFIADNIKQYLGPHMNVHVRAVGAIPTSGSGKRRRIVSRVSPTHQHTISDALTGPVPRG